MSGRNVQGRKASADSRKSPAKWKGSVGCRDCTNGRLHGYDDFVDASDAKRKMQAWVGNSSKFHPHAAQYDFEAWLLPFWSDIQTLAGHNKSAPPGTPEKLNHNRPPSYHIREIFRAGTCRDDYSKPRDAARILRGKDLAVSANRCPELKAFLNTILTLSGAEPL